MMPDFDKDFKPPFTKKGEPQKYLRLLLPLFSKEFTRKEEMLRLMGVDIGADPKKRNTHSTTLWKLSKNGVLQTKARGNGAWRRGENWNLFMGWLTMHIMQNPQTQDKFKDMLVDYGSNAMNFIMKGD